ncbi:MAG: nucleoside triphosphate pyrophosphohydrolase [Desulfobacterales bacterium]|nr:nucleoside triphosphate pyrophosphohydrolase [Desulfobacterales bacterium]
MGVDALVELIETLRGENGCPWDRKQTPDSIAIYLVEETHELVDAIQSGKSEDVREELGDVLFQLLFITSMFQEKGRFDLEGVTRGITEKMIHRHPHVFGDASVSGSEEVKRQWQRLKMEEKNHQRSESILDSVPAGLPALMRAYRVSERTASAGFEHGGAGRAIETVEEAWTEFKSGLGEDGAGQEEVDEPRREDATRKFGDLLLAMVNAARSLNIHPETALAGAAREFEKRFRREEAGRGEGP